MIIWILHGGVTILAPLKNKIMKESIYNRNNFGYYDALLDMKKVIVGTLKEKIGCCNNLDDKICHSIFNYSSQFLVALGSLFAMSIYDFDRKIGCCS